MAGRALLVLTLAMAMGLAPALAKVDKLEPDPATWLRQVYDLYVEAERTGTLGTEASMTLLEDRASKSLAALFKMNHACEKREAGGECAIDFDWIVDGQDEKLSHVQVGHSTVAGDKATVTVTFINLGAHCANTYYFVREAGAWKLDDLLVKQGKLPPNRLAKQLRAYGK